MKNLRAILAQEGLLKTAKLLRRKLRGRGADYIVEITPQQEKALKVVPGGKGRSIHQRSGIIQKISWSKRGGYIDSLERKFWDAAKSAGFRQIDSSSDAHPADFYVSSGWVGKDPEGNILRFSSSFGQTKSDNRFYISLEFETPLPVLP